MAVLSANILKVTELEMIYGVICLVCELQISQVIFKNQSPIS